MINVVLIFGGRSGEHEVSLRSAQSIYNGFDKTKYDVTAVCIAKSGKWYGPVDPEDIASFKEENYVNNEVGFLPKPGKTLYNFKDFSAFKDIDIVFPIIHGTNGEDGTLQGLLEYMDMPYTGSGVCGSAVGMDKIIMKDIYKANQIPQVNYVGLDTTRLFSDPDAVEKEILEALTLPLFVKPANLGSSVGITKVKDKASLRDALLFAAKYDRRIVIEEGRNVREIEVSALGNHEVLLSGYGEVIPGSEFYDYESKYIYDTSVTKMADDLSTEQLKTLDFYSKKAYQVLDLAGFTRIDFFIDKDNGEILINEVNTLPGFTSISMYPKLWEEQGMPINELLDHVIRLGFDRYEEKNKLKRDF